MKRNRYFDFSKKASPQEKVWFIVEVLILLGLSWPLLSHLFG